MEIIIQRWFEFWSDCIFETTASSARSEDEGTISSTPDEISSAGSGSQLSGDVNVKMTPSTWSSVFPTMSEMFAYYSAFAGKAHFLESGLPGTNVAGSVGLESLGLCGYGGVPDSVLAEDDPRTSIRFDTTEVLETCTVIASFLHHESPAWASETRGVEDNVSSRETFADARQRQDSDPGQDGTRGSTVESSNDTFAPHSSCQSRLLDFHHDQALVSSMVGGREDDERGETQTSSEKQPMKDLKKLLPNTFLYNPNGQDCVLLHCEMMGQLKNTFTRPRFLSEAAYNRDEMRMFAPSSPAERRPPEAEALFTTGSTVRSTFVPKRRNNYTEGVESGSAWSSRPPKGIGSSSTSIVVPHKFYVFSHFCGNPSWIMEYAELAWTARLDMLREQLDEEELNRNKDKIRQDWGFMLRREKETIDVVAAGSTGGGVVASATATVEDGATSSTEQGRSLAQQHSLDHFIFKLFGAETTPQSYSHNLKMELAEVAASADTSESERLYHEADSGLCRIQPVAAPFSHARWPKSTERAVDDLLAGADLKLYEEERKQILEALQPPESTSPGASISAGAAGEAQNENPLFDKASAAIHVSCHVFLVWPQEQDLLTEHREATFPYCDGVRSIVVSSAVGDVQSLRERLRSAGKVESDANSNSDAAGQRDSSAAPVQHRILNLQEVFPHTPIRVDEWISRDVDKEVPTTSSSEAPGSMDLATIAGRNGVSNRGSRREPPSSSGGSGPAAAPTRNLLQKTHYGMVAVADAVYQANVAEVEPSSAASARTNVMKWHCFLESDVYFIPENFKRFVYSRFMMLDKKTNTDAQEQNFEDRDSRSFWLGLVHSHRVAASEGYLLEPLQAGCFTERALLDFAAFLKTKLSSRRDVDEFRADTEEASSPSPDAASKAAVGLSYSSAEDEDLTDVRPSGTDKVLSSVDANSCDDPFNPNVDMLFLHVFSACVKHVRPLIRYFPALPASELRRSLGSLSSPDTTQPRPGIIFAPFTEPYGRVYHAGPLNLMGSFTPRQWRASSWSYQIPQLGNTNDHWLLSNNKAMSYYLCLGDQLEIAEAEKTEERNAEIVAKSLLAENDDEQDEMQKVDHHKVENVEDSDAAPESSIRVTGKERQLPQEAKLSKKSALLGKLNLVSRYPVSFDGHFSVEKSLFFVGKTAPRKQNFPIRILHRMVRLQQFDCPEKFCGTLRPVVWGREMATQDRSVGEDVGIDGSPSPFSDKCGKGLVAATGVYPATERTAENDGRDDIDVTDTTPCPVTEHQEKEDPTHSSLPEANTTAIVAALKHRVSMMWKNDLSGTARALLATLPTARNALFWTFLWTAAFFDEGASSGEKLGTLSDTLRETVVEKIEACWVSAGLDRRLGIAREAELIDQFLRECGTT
ncbi:unnamed protein product [Amoebophrya sp. A120]|nr:unnamed protein product [Amoebophrya sp. A120]|eukprot:GSA120T00010740001.1